jgi:ribosomal protein S18 acetylase RimI-like enzyme
MEIIPAEQNDAKEIVSMILEEFPYAKISAKKLENKMKRKAIRVFKAVEGEKIIGFLELEKLDSITARINGISVKPELRGKGIGKKILEYGIDFLKSKKIKRILLMVKQSNTEAKKLYAEIGFKFMGLLENKIDNDTIEELELNLGAEDDEELNYVG